LFWACKYKLFTQIWNDISRDLTEF
jgi:hypothetical protein